MKKISIVSTALLMLLLSGCGGASPDGTMQECTENHKKIYKMSKLQYSWCEEK